MSDDEARREFLKLLKPLPPREKIIAFRKWMRAAWQRGASVQEIILASKRPPWKSKTEEGEWIN